MSPRGKKKTEQVEDNAAPETPYEHPVDEVTGDVPPSLEASVYNKDGVFIRKYDFQTHGVDFAKLAHQYATKIGGSVK